MSANAKLFIAGVIALAIGLAPVIPKSSTDIISGWFIGYTFPLVLGGAGLIVFAGVKSVLAVVGVQGFRATILAGIIMVVQYFIVQAVQLGFVVSALSFGVAFSGFVACLAVIVPRLRGLAARAQDR